MVQSEEAQCRDTIFLSGVDVNKWSCCEKYFRDIAMSTQLEVRPEIADDLTPLANARGVLVDDLLQEVLDGLELPQRR